MNISIKRPSFKTIINKIDAKKINTLVHEGLRIVSDLGVYKILKSITKPMIKTGNPWTKIAVGIGSCFLASAFEKVVSEKIEDQKKAVDIVIDQARELKKFHDETGTSYPTLVKTLYKVVLKKVHESEEEAPEPKKETPKNKKPAAKGTKKQRATQASRKRQTQDTEVSQETMDLFNSAFAKM